VSDLEA